MSRRPARRPAVRPTVVVSRRTLLVAAGVVPLVGVVGGCTAEAPGADAVTPDQVDLLADQVAAQAALVEAGAVAFAASPELAASAAVLAQQWQEQLDRLRAAAPSVGSSAVPTAASSGAAPTDGAAGTDPRAGLRAQVAATADSHSSACLGFTGARAALLGSIAAGLRGQDGQLA
ncbi:hypothetical protein SAMN03159343_2961 [Klenkia marina]|uniref:DUF4439 domain-containing protein n=1 Tax=Klenkia marina TaxID=1960309 RepID=A0A1G4YIL5_9ACTN|nr:hypothetical protein [Klenkia marina]SCX53347.1 hypothetical protein SAMN03159343_2961 [Klenkia marina]